MTGLEQLRVYFKGSCFGLQSAIFRGDSKLKECLDMMKGLKIFELVVPCDHFVRWRQCLGEETAFDIVLNGQSSKPALTGNA